jgi:YidC/Oxa1 family membrane protein insertase
MRAVQPKMKALQERYKDDKPKLQQEMAKLYKDEKINPLAGCLPIFLQIPIFFALYKVLLLAIEMRHEPFYLWIKDLSAPDPAHHPQPVRPAAVRSAGFLAIGLLAVILGLTMWLQFKLNPAAMDPVQQQIFMIMPWVLMFVMAPFAAGLLLYWITSNILTLGQQKYLYSKHPQLKARPRRRRPSVSVLPPVTRQGRWRIVSTGRGGAAAVSGRVEFLLSAPTLQFLPDAEHPEVAFAGRSNVGKSSLINA